MKLSDGEKLILLMLSDISKKLGAQREVDPDFVAHTLFYDQTWGFNWKFHGIPFDDKEQPPAVDETVDILDMFALTMGQFKQMPSDQQEVIKQQLGHAAHGLDQFPGFDGNNDEHHGIAQYLVEYLDRFKHVPGAINNSHSQASLPRYRKMLKVFKPLRDALAIRKFTPEEIVSIFKSVD